MNSSNAVAHSKEQNDWTTHCISDLHLCSEKPHLFELFKYYMQTIAPSSNRLFVLGDLFEVWLGDDCLDSINQENGLKDYEIYQATISLFLAYSQSGRSLYFIHGNRDFLLGKTFEKLCGGQLLSEPFIEEQGGIQVGYLHGDSLCVDDKAYQEFRAQVRQPQWQSQFTGLPMTERLDIASNLREQSQQAQKEKSMEIMDVNAQAVDQYMLDHRLDLMIHGHTHRQKTHDWQINSKHYKRVVLSDWGEKGFYLSFKNSNPVESISENYFSCPTQ